MHPENRMIHMYFQQFLKFTITKQQRRGYQGLSPASTRFSGLPLPTPKTGTRSLEQIARKKYMRQRRQKRIRTRGWA